MEINLNYLLMCRDISKQIEEAKASLNQATRPVLTDISLVKPICDVIEKEYADRSSVVSRAKIFIVLYIYAPAKLISRDCSHSRVMDILAEHCGIGKDLLSRYKSEAVGYYRVNNDFRSEVDRIMGVLTKQFFE